MLWLSLEYYYMDIKYYLSILVFMQWNYATVYFTIDGYLRYLKFRAMKKHLGVFYVSN